MNTRPLITTSVVALVASMALIGCSKREEANARNAADSTIAQVSQASRNLAADASSGMEKAKAATREAALDAKDKVGDAVITSGVKAELAKDSNLSAMKINVDTENGQVALHGTAPTADAREHATALAQGVKGVVGVDNQLTVDPSK